MQGLTEGSGLQSKPKPSVGQSAWYLQELRLSSSELAFGERQGRATASPSMELGLGLVRNYCRKEKAISGTPSEPPVSSQLGSWSETRAAAGTS